MARVYGDAAYVNAAIKEFEISIEMDGKDWVALEGMALCYQYREDYLGAIEWDYKALAALPKESTVEKAEILQEISRWKSMLEDKNGAIEAAHAAYSLSPQDSGTSVAYLYELGRDCRFQVILDFAAKLEMMKSDQGDENMLTLLFVETWGRAHDIIGNAARRMGKIDLVEQPMRYAVAVAEQKISSRGPASPHFCLLGWAKFLNRYAYKMNEAIVVYETALERFSTRKGYEYFFREIKDSLCQLYYDKAEAAERAGAQFDHWVAKLEALTKISNAQDEQNISTSVASSMMLGLWYRLHGREQDAKLCFRPQILDGIDTLTDDDPENDIDGYITLGLTLLKAGDRENARAALAVTTAPLDRLKDVRRAAQKISDDGETSVRVPLPSIDAATLAESLSPSLEKIETKDPEGTSPVGDSNDADQNAVAPDDNGELDMDSAEINAQVKRSFELNISFVWGCDGKCIRPVEDWQEVHICEICPDYTCFCDECIKLVKAGTLPFRKCDEDHTFYQAYPLSEEIRDVATVRTEGKVLPRTEWLETLRKQWVV